METLANAFATLIHDASMDFLADQILKYTVLGALMTALSPASLLNIGKIIGNLLSIVFIRLRVLITSPL